MAAKTSVVVVGGGGVANGLHISESRQQWWAESLQDFAQDPVDITHGR